MMDKGNLKLFIKISQHRMYNHYLPKLLFSIKQLNSEQLWHHEAPGLNTIGGIVLHICEHVKRNAIRFSNQGPTNFPTGIENYFPDVSLSIQELLQIVDRSKMVTNKSFDFCQNGLNEKSLKLLIEGEERRKIEYAQKINRTSETTKWSNGFYYVETYEYCSYRDNEMDVAENEHRR
jgi:hypothetical protein